MTESYEPLLDREFAIAGARELIDLASPLLAYELTGLPLFAFGSRLKLDVLHAFSPQESVELEQQRFLAVDPTTNEQFSPNPTFGAPLAHQLPMTVRLGVEVGMR